MPPDNIDASKENVTRTCLYITRRETVMGHTPLTHVTDDVKLIFLYVLHVLYIHIQFNTKKKKDAKYVYE